MCVCCETAITHVNRESEFPKTKKKKPQKENKPSDKLTKKNAHTHLYVKDGKLINIYNYRNFPYATCEPGIGNGIGDMNVTCGNGVSGGVGKWVTRRGRQIM